MANSVALLEILEELSVLESAIQSMKEKVQRLLAEEVGTGGTPSSIEGEVWSFAGIPHQEAMTLFHSFLAFFRAESSEQALASSAIFRRFWNMHEVRIFNALQRVHVQNFEQLQTLTENFPYIRGIGEKYEAVIKLALRAIEVVQSEATHQGGS